MYTFPGMVCSCVKVIVDENEIYLIWDPGTERVKKIVRINLSTVNVWLTLLTLIFIGPFASYKKTVFVAVRALKKNSESVSHEFSAGPIGSYKNVFSIIVDEFVFYE